MPEVPGRGFSAYTCELPGASVLTVSARPNLPSSSSLFAVADCHNTRPAKPDALGQGFVLTLAIDEQVRWCRMTENRGKFALARLNLPLH